MKIHELIVTLSESELSNLDLGSSGDGCIADPDLNKVINAINSVLTTLHRKYLLKQGMVSLVTVGEVLEYQLTPTNFIKYLFALYTTENTTIPINDSTCGYAIHTYGSSKVTVPYKGTYELYYQANHPLINKANMGMELDVPVTLVQPIRDWVAHAIYGSMNTVESANTSIRYLASYNQALAEIERSDALNDSRLGINSKFTNNGWI